MNNRSKQSESGDEYWVAHYTRSLEHSDERHVHLDNCGESSSDLDDVDEMVEETRPSKLSLSEKAAIGLSRAGSKAILTTRTNDESLTRSPSAMLDEQPKDGDSPM